MKVQRPREREERTFCLGSWQNHQRSGYIETDSWRVCMSFLCEGQRGHSELMEQLGKRISYTKNKNHDVFRKWVERSGKGFRISWAVSYLCEEKYQP